MMKYYIYVMLLIIIENNMKNIYDVCMFFNENDLLEVKLNEQWDHINKFIIIESLQTHEGHSKIQNFDKDRFKKYDDKIIYILLHSLDDTYDSHPYLLPSTPMTDSWAREKIQTNYCLNIFNDLGLSDNDQIMWGGLDEIVSSKTLSELIKDDHSIVSFNLTYFIYKLNIKWNSQAGTCITSYANYKKFLPSEIREKFMGQNNIILNAGWHFTGLSRNKENLRIKYTSFAHAHDEFWKDINILSDDQLEEKVIKSYIPDFFINKHKYITHIDSSYPLFIQQNINKYKDYIYG